MNSYIVNLYYIRIGTGIVKLFNKEKNAFEAANKTQRIPLIIYKFSKVVDGKGRKKTEFPSFKYVERLVWPMTYKAVKTLSKASSGSDEGEGQGESHGCHGNRMLRMLCFTENVVQIGRRELLRTKLQ
ncbi:hypothetical protein TNCT_277021 [Trichonephila clavata]|uniref:Uncharacterized protein n=1 Tax=Trichonephila clavata TaxID=2740835 RepID=A0A8X6F0Y1_TRICU|nr:hypothetical protein TNCT_277021 [Trichonephila clavata]